MARVRVPGHLPQLQHRLAAELASTQPGLPVTSGPGREDGLHLLVEPLLVFALRVLLVDQVRPVESLAKRFPELGLEGAHAHVAAVGTAINAVAGVAAGEALHGPRPNRALRRLLG